MIVTYNLTPVESRRVIIERRWEVWEECEWCEGQGSQDGDWTCDDCQGSGGWWHEKVQKNHPNGNYGIFLSVDSSAQIFNTVTKSSILIQSGEECVECGGSGIGLWLPKDHDGKQETWECRSCHGSGINSDTEEWRVK